MGVILYLASVPAAAQIIHPDCDLKTASTFHTSLWRNKHGNPRFLSQVFAKNSLIKKIFEEEKSLIVEHDFFGKNSFVFGVFGLRRGLQANYGSFQKSAISPQPGNQKRTKWSTTAYLKNRGVARIFQRGGHRQGHHPGIADYIWFIPLLSLVYQRAQSYYRGIKAHIK